MSMRRTGWFSAGGCILTAAIASGQGSIPQSTMTTQEPHFAAPPDPAQKPTRLPEIPNVSRLLLEQRTPLASAFEFLPVPSLLAAAGERDLNLLRPMAGDRTQQIAEIVGVHSLLSEVPPRFELQTPPPKP